MRMVMHEVIRPDVIGLLCLQPDAGAVHTTCEQSLGGVEADKACSASQKDRGHCQLTPIKQSLIAVQAAARILYRKQLPPA